MRTFSALVRRNVKMFFKDKGMFFTSLITPIILLVLYATFLARIYRDSFVSALPDGLAIDEKLISATVGGQLMSSLLAVSCVTVSFCANLLSVQDRVSGARKDMLVTPVRRSTIAGAYYVGTLATTVIVSLVATAACFVYLAINGWYLSFGDVALIILDVVILTMFGTALASVVNAFLTSNGLGGVYREMSSIGCPSGVVEGLKDSVDCNIYFFGSSVPIGAMYAVILGAVVVLVGAYVLINVLKKRA